MLTAGAGGEKGLVGWELITDGESGKYCLWPQGKLNKNQNTASENLVGRAVLDKGMAHIGNS